MKVAIVLHLYQPPVQEEGIFRQVASECYLPLIKLIKNRRNHKFTLDIPLSLLEQMEKYGYGDWIADVRSLYEGERIELLGSAAFHPLLTKIPRQIAEEQIALNEYGLGYYFGSRHGFEGEPSIMIKNIQGFFPPELAVNDELAGTLSDFGYRWFLAEETCLPDDADRNSCIFGFKDKNILVVCRDRTASNAISFKREHSVEDVVSYIASKNSEKSPVIIALDAEYFGHHYREGIYVLENLLDKLEEFGTHLSAVSDLVDEYEYSEISGICECSWGASDEEFDRGETLPFWVSKDNDLQEEMWKLQDLVIKEYLLNYKIVNTIEFQTLPIWKTETLKSIQDNELQSEISKYILLHTFLYSDKFWWASKKEILGKYLYDISILTKSLDLAYSFFKWYPNDDIMSEALQKIETLRSLLK